MPTHADLPGPAPHVGAAVPDRRAAPYRSFWMERSEGARHLNEDGAALDMAHSGGHLDRPDEGYRQAAARGLLSVRESIGWRLCEAADGRFDFARVDETAPCWRNIAARRRISSWSATARCVRR